MAEQRASLVEEIEAGEQSISELCRRYGISRRTAYKWLARSERGESMECRSKTPLSSPNKTSPSVESVVVQARKQHPCWGGHKLMVYLRRKGVIGVPSAKTVTAILHRNGLISDEASRAATSWKRFEMDEPNDLWQTDFKGHFAMEDGNRCHPLTVTDDMSRFSLCVSAKGNERLEGVKDSFVSLFRKHGLPKIVLCDNGPPWGIPSIYGYTRFEVFLMVRNSTKYVSYKDLKAVCASLKRIYSAATEEAGQQALAEFGEEWDAKYPAIRKAWEQKWGDLSEFFKYPDEIRKAIYTTNAIESLNFSLRKVTKNRQIFPNDTAIYKILYLAIGNASKKWTMPIKNWSMAINQFAIIFGDERVKII